MPDQPYHPAMLLQNYQYHTPSQEEPWWADMTPAHPHYNRALQLSNFLRDIRRGPSLLMKARKLAYRQHCIDNWQHYLETGVPPK
jgi:hypothetical protein